MEKDKRDYHKPCACQKHAPVPCDKPKCNKCNGSAGNCFCLPPKVVPTQVDGCPILFRKVVIPSSVGDETTYPPVAGLYRNVLVEYEASGAAYLYSSDGIPTLISDIAEVRRLEKRIEDEEDARKNADDEIWAEIETIELASDVVDIVGTYAELQAYDTSKLTDKDLIKVLQDETHDDAITYYRWNTATHSFSYVGSEGPYYTCAETDILLNGKQDTLTAGDNISISDNVISAVDTTYAAGTGISITDGVISSTVKSGVMLYFRYESSIYKFYRDSSYTDLVTYAEMVQMLEDGNVQIVDNPVGMQEMIYTVVAHTTSEQSQGEILDFVVYGGDHYYMFYWFDTDAGANRSMYYTQNRLTAGTNIQINGTTISATDTTYSAFGGATAQQAGTAGLVPAPTTSDPEKFLKGDGTWGTPVGKVYTAGTNIDISAQDVISVTGMPVLYGAMGQNTDGAVTQKFFTDTVGDIETILQILNSGAGVP